MKLKLKLALILAGCCLAPAAALSQTYPNKPITIIMPGAAGSANDNVVRIIGNRLSERLKQPVIIENRAGGNLQIGVEHFLKQKPDGYTLLFTTNTSHAGNPSLYKTLRYDPIKDFTPIIRVGQIPFVIAVNNNLPARNLAEFIGYARANPGKVSFGSANSGSLVAGSTLAARAKLEMVNVPYKDSNQTLTDLIGGHLHMYPIDFVTGTPSIKGGKIRALAVTSPRSSSLLPGVPPVSDTFPGFDVISWNGFFGHASTPRPIIDFLAAEVSSILAEPATRDALASRGLELMQSSSPEEFGQYVRDQIVLWARLIKQAGIEPE